MDASCKLPTILIYTNITVKNFHLTKNLQNPKFLPHFQKNYKKMGTNLLPIQKKNVYDNKKIF